MREVCRPFPQIADGDAARKKEIPKTENRLKFQCTRSRANKNGPGVSRAVSFKCGQSLLGSRKAAWAGLLDTLEFVDANRNNSFRVGMSELIVLLVERIGYLRAAKRTPHTLQD